MSLTEEWIHFVCVNIWDWHSRRRWVQQKHFHSLSLKVDICSHSWFALLLLSVFVTKHSSTLEDVFLWRFLVHFHSTRPNWQPTGQSLALLLVIYCPQSPNYFFLAKYVNILVALYLSQTSRIVQLLVTGQRMNHILPLVDNIIDYYSTLE